MQGPVIMRTLILLLAVSASLLHAEIVDRIVALVDGRVITESAALEEANYQAFDQNLEPVTALDGQSLRLVVSRMADQVLLEKEESNSPFSPPSSGDAERTLSGIRKRWPDAEQFQRALARYHLNEGGMTQRILRQQRILGFVDYQLRPRVSLEPGRVETYYRETLLPELQQQGQSETPPLEEVRAQIQQVLIQQEINRLLDEWLVQLRSHAKIRMMPSADNDPATPGLPK